MKHCTALVGFFLSFSLLAQSPAASILFILDGSGSMWAPLNQKPKIELAKSIMSDLILQLPGNISAGLEVYGHRSADDCKDIELLSTPSDADKTLLMQQVQSITPRGKTPLAEALKLAVETLDKSAAATAIVLISDGAENCAGDPCKLINKQAGKTRVHVIGFALNPAEQEQLQCIASAGGGRYFDAQNAQQLAQALAEIQQAVLATTTLDTQRKPVVRPEGAAVTASGTLEIRNFLNGEVYIFDEVTDEELGYYCKDCPQSISLPTGVYKLEFPSFVAEGVEINPAAQTLFDLDTVAGRLIIQNHTGGDVIIRPSVAYQDSEIYLLDRQTGAQQAVYCGACGKAVQLPVGFYTLEFSDFIVEGVEIMPGETTLFDPSAAAR